MGALFQQLDNFLNNAPIPIVGVGKRGIIQAWNDRAEAIFGWQKQEVIGHKFTDIVTLSAQDKLQWSLLARATKERSQAFELLGIHRDGKAFPIKIFIVPLKIDQTILRYIFVSDVGLQHKTEKKLEQSDQHFRLLVEGIKDYSIYLINPSGIIISWNLGAERMKGYKSHEVLGKHYSLFFPKPEIDIGKPQYELKVALSDGKYEGEGWRVRKDGTFFWAHVLTTPIWDDNGKLQGFAKITRDLTSRRLAQEALQQTQERYRLLVDSIPDYAIFMLDTKGRVTSWNIGAERIQGYKAEEIIGEHFSRFYTKEDILAGKPMHGLQIAAEKGRYEDVGWRVRKDGSKFWAHVIINAIRDELGRFTGFSKVTRDLTEQQKMSEAERALKMRDEFLSIAAHELKTPLTTLKLQLQLTQDELSKESMRMPSRQELLKIVDDCLRWVNSLTNLVSELLDISRIRAGNFHLKLEEVNLSSLVKEIVAYYMPQLLAAKCPSVELDLDAEVTLYCDRNRIEQVIVNLLSNIIKHAPESLVYIYVGRKDENRVLLIVQDFGPGIAKENQGKVFQRFEQATPSASGLGLGLYITKGIIEAHRGTIRLESELGKGTAFIIELPVSPSED
jgi:PAS domain S-box-containing protein